MRYSDRRWVWKVVGAIKVELSKRAFITEAETLALIRYVEKAPEDIVEVGTFAGGTAENIAPHIPRGLALWSIDLFGRPHRFEGDMNPSTLYHKYLVDFGNVFFVMGDSREIGKYWGSNIGFLFIDGNHQVDVVLKDFEVWAPWVVPGGVVALHDSTGCKNKEQPQFRPLREPNYNLPYEPGPARAVQVAVESGEWKVVEEVDTITFLVRVERRS